MSRWRAPDHPGPAIGEVRAGEIRPELGSYSTAVLSSGQLTFVAGPRVLLQYHPDRPPAGASGPREIGAFSATLADYPEMIGGWARDEQSAIELLADLLRSHAADSPPRGGLTPYGQALMAAHRLTRTDLIDYLRGRAEEATLAADAESLSEPSNRPS